MDLPDRYKLQEEVSKSNMGIVFKARHKQTRAALAIKVLHPHLSENSDYLLRFEKEARAASTLKHPNIATMHDFGVTPNLVAFLVTEWLDGPSLDKVVKLSGPLTGQQFVAIFVQAANALSHAHSMGVVHRDIKPGNIILTVSDESADNVKIVDFGIARILTDDLADGPANELDLTADGTTLSSALFMSPEQCSGGKIDHRSDIYSLGCVMYEAICGTPPLTGSTPAQIYHKHLNKMPKQPRTINPAITKPELYEPMLFKCLQKDPNKRYSSMDELEQDLKTIKDALRKS
jgi:serine/threonine-protein kinase